MTKAILFYRNSLLTKLFMLVIVLVGGGNSVWGDTVLFSTNFSEADGWTTEDIITSSTTSATKTIKGTEISFKGYSTSNLTVTADASSGTLKFTGKDLTVSNETADYYMAIPVTGIEGGVVSVEYTFPSYSSLLYYTYDDGNTGNVVNRRMAPSGSKFVISGLTNNQATIYLGASGKSISSISITTPNNLTNLSESSFYGFYKESSSAVSAATLISNASLPSYITFNREFYTGNYSSSSSIVDAPNDFTTITSGKYYMLNPSASNSIYICGLSHVKSIRVYGNGNATGTITTTVAKMSGDGTAMSVPVINFENNKTSIKEWSTGNLSELSGYDADTYYHYTLTFSNGNFYIWGLYIEYNAPSSYTVTYHPNGGSGEISDATGSSITLSDGTGFSAPTGYTFAGWNTDPHGIGTSYASGETGVEADLTLYAVWTQSGTIDDNGGTADGAYTATYNKAGIEITTAPTNGSYAIKGYYEADTDENLVATSAGALEASTTYTDVSGYWTHTGSAPTLYAQWENTHTLTVNVNDGDMGSAEADETTIAEGSTTNVTATANPSYKFRSWAVSGTGASLSSTTSNPSSFTMGTADATVTATFSALETYTISYVAGSAEGVTGSKADESKTEDVAFTLPNSAVFTRSGYVQTGWATEDGGDQAYELGGSYTTNAAQTFYPSWTEQYTLTYHANGGEGSMPSYEGLGNITLAANTYTKVGYTFMGWATSQDNADAGTVDYADEADYTLSSNATLYAVWAENFYEFTLGESSGYLAKGDEIKTSTGGTMTVHNCGTNTISYTTNGLYLQGYNDTLRVSLNDFIKEGSVITMKLRTAGANVRNVYILTSSKSEVTSFGFSSTAKAGDEDVFSFTVTAKNKLISENSFLIRRSAALYIQSLTVTDCQPGGVINAAGWNTYSSNKKLNLSTISGGTAYVASSSGDATVRMKACTDIVNAAEGLMIKGEPGATFTINTTTEEANFVGTNLMVGLPNGGTVAAEDGNYVFGWTNAAEPGFYFINSTEPTLGAGKAYLHVGGVVGARLAISFADETPTSINSINNSQELNTNNFYFDLQGRKVKNPTKGLYISNGKKVFVGNKH